MFCALVAILTAGISYTVYLFMQNTGIHNDVIGHITCIFTA